MEAELHIALALAVLSLGLHVLAYARRRARRAEVSRFVAEAMQQDSAKRYSDFATQSSDFLERLSGEQPTGAAE